MRLVGRESHSDAPNAELLTFECECGQITTVTTNQWASRPPRLHRHRAGRKDIFRLPYWSLAQRLAM